MARVIFDSSAPCGFLIVEKGKSIANEDDTILIQADWDFPGVASCMGFVPCECRETDGTIDCAHKTASEMISAAYDYIREHEGERFDGLDEYFRYDRRV